MDTIKQFLSVIFSVVTSLLLVGLGIFIFMFSGVIVSVGGFLLLLIGVVAFIAMLVYDWLTEKQ